MEKYEFENDPQILPEKLKQERLECPLCNKNFPRKRFLDRHIRLHTGEKPYKCDICHADFCQKSELISHSRTHALKTVFHRHLQTHTREYAKKFANFRTHSNENHFTCNFVEKEKLPISDEISTNRNEKKQKEIIQQLLDEELMIF